jgi:SAM-dependent methyltransferase
MGRYSVQLSPQLAELAEVRARQRVLDVGCGPGALTGELVRLVGADAVAAVDPSESFVAAARERHPTVDVRRAPAEQLPFADEAFDAALAQLVVHFMADPVAGLREMARVTRPGGVVAACVWDHAGGRTPLGVFWQAALELDPEAHDESQLAGAREGHLTELFAAAALSSVQETTVTATGQFATFDEWWEPLTHGVGPAGAHIQSLTEPARDELRARCRELLPAPPFTITTVAWAARGLV